MPPLPRRDLRNLVTIAAAGAIPPLVQLMLWPGSDADVVQHAEAALDHLADNSNANELTIDAVRASVLLEMEWLRLYSG
ncbi:hypothetical protein FOA52_001253 [Chlamydomonas sp. UWO 241]|nr:hypothetical protein FOA52_001253 [Chlamydomonas sp. UWO 241]